MFVFYVCKLAANNFDKCKKACRGALLLDYQITRLLLLSPHKQDSLIKQKLHLELFQGKVCKESYLRRKGRNSAGFLESCNVYYKFCIFLVFMCHYFKILHLQAYKL